MLENKVGNVQRRLFQSFQSGNTDVLMDRSGLDPQDL
jgi:hypothetical protein